MTTFDIIAGLFRMTDAAWRRHANPWSVWTRFGASPAMIVAIWSRVWIGWWALAPIALVIVWLFLNPHLFPPVTRPQSWAATGIYGEKLWLHSKGQLPPGYRTILRWLIAPGILGFVLLAWGLAELSMWSTVFGATLVILVQLWRIDRMGLLYDEIERMRSSMR